MEGCHCPQDGTRSKTQRIALYLSPCLVSLSLALLSFSVGCGSPSAPLVVDITGLALYIPVFLFCWLQRSISICLLGPEALTNSCFLAFLLSCLCFLLSYLAVSSSTSQALLKRSFASPFFCGWLLGFPSNHRVSTACSELLCFAVCMRSDWTAVEPLVLLVSTSCFLSFCLYLSGSLPFVLSYISLTS